MKRTIPLALSYDDVLLVPQYSTINSRSEVDLKTKITPKVELSLPLVSINMTDVTGVSMAIKMAQLGGIGFLPRFVSQEKQADMVSEVKKHNLKVGAAIGCKEESLERAEMLVKAGADIITVDVAHGAMEKVIQLTKNLKRKYKDVGIISGVIATKDSAESLFKAGADSVRVGVGPGTICKTRIVTGVGVPQITAVLEAAKAARKHNKTILCDGGTKNSGDIMKGLAAGASAVIIGSQFAGTDEAPGKIVIVQGKKYKQYNGSTSYAEKKKHEKNLKGISKNYINHIEGVESLVPYKGPVKEIITLIEANLRAGFSYSGSKDIKQLWKKAQFVQITSAGMKESQPHDILLSK